MREGTRQPGGRRGGYGGGEGNTKEGVGITGERGNEGGRWMGWGKREGRG